MWCHPGCMMHAFDPGKRHHWQPFQTCIYMVKLLFGASPRAFILLMEQSTQGWPPGEELTVWCSSPNSWTYTRLFHGNDSYSCIGVDSTASQLDWQGPKIGFYKYQFWRRRWVKFAADCIILKRRYLITWTWKGYSTKIGTTCRPTLVLVNAIDSSCEWQLLSGVDDIMLEERLVAACHGLESLS